MSNCFATSYGVYSPATGDFRPVAGMEADGAGRTEYITNTLALPEGLEMKDFFKPHLLEHYDEWINSKNYTVKEINNMIGAKSLRDIMTDEGRDKSNPKTARLYRSLMFNSVLDFSPQVPLHMFHSTVDKTVPFVNSEKAEVYFKGQNVTYDFAPYGAHGTGFIHFILKVIKQL